MTAIRITRTSTTLPAGGADTAVTLNNLSLVEAVRIISAPVDAALKFGATTETAIPVSPSDPARNELALSNLYGSSSTGGTLVLELHGR